MTLLLLAKNAFLAFMPFMFMLLPSSASFHAEHNNDEESDSSSSSKQYLRDHRRQQQQRRIQGFYDVITGSNNEVEWYLPDVKVNIKKTWLFGAGDPSEWGGNGTTSTILPTPIEVPLLAGEHITDISAGGLHSAILTNEGRILTAGSSTAGESLGLGRDTMDGTELGFMPVKEVYPIDQAGQSTSLASTTELPQFVKVEASEHFTFALDNLGRVWSTGNNAYSQLCLNDTTTRDRFHQVKMPYHNQNGVFDQQPEGSKIVDIVLGERHTLLLREDGKAYGCGWNQYGQLGIGMKGQNVASPAEITIDAPDDNATTSNGGKQINHEVITDAVAGRGSSYFLTSSGHVYATGTNYKGQLCLGHREDRTLPTMIGNVDSFLSFLDDSVDVESIAASQSSFYLLLSNGLVLACGDNTHGQLGIGNDDEDSLDLPKAIANVTDVDAIFSGPMSFGGYFVSDRMIYAVGFDGVGARENWDVPNMMACVNEDTTLKKGVVISSGNDHTLYLATVETTLECEGGTAATTAPQMASSVPAPTPPTGSPTVSLSPSASSSYYSSPNWPYYSPPPSPYGFGITESPTSPTPTASSPPSPAPTASSAPTISPAPSSTPTASSAPSITSAPSSSPTRSSAPTITSAPSTIVVLPPRTLPNPSSGSRGLSLDGLGLSVLAVSALSFSCQYF